MLGILILIIVFLLSAWVFYYAFLLYLKHNPQKEDNRPGYLKGATQLDEYSRLLELFSLDDTASEDEIKAAYRQHMREHHPDTAGEKTEEDRQQFIELKKAYERILELKRGRFAR